MLDASLLLDRFIVTVAPMVDRTAWRVPWDIIAAVARAQADAEDGWCRLSRRGLAKKAGCSDGRLWELLGNPGPLWRTQWVLERGAIGVGTRPTELRVVLDIGRWRGVPWREPDAEVRELRLQAALAPLLPVLGTVAAMASGAVLTAPLRGASGAVLYRATEGTGGMAQLLQHNGFRSDVAPLSGAVLDRATSDPSPVHSLLGHRATRSGRPAPSTSPRGLAFDSGGFRDTDPSALGGEREQVNGPGRATTDPLVERVVEAINDKCRANNAGSFYRGSRLEPRLRRLVADVDVDQLLAGVEAADVAFKPPMIVSFLEDVARGAVSLTAGGGTSSTSIEGRLANLDRLIATYAELGDEPPEDLVSERQRWQTELDQRKELVDGRRDAAQCESSPAA